MFQICDGLWIRSLLVEMSFRWSNQPVLTSSVKPCRQVRSSYFFTHHIWWVFCFGLGNFVASEGSAPFLIETSREHSLFRRGSFVIRRRYWPVTRSISTFRVNLTTIFSKDFINSTKWASSSVFKYIDRPAPMRVDEMSTNGALGHWTLLRLMSSFLQGWYRSLCSFSLGHSTKSFGSDMWMSNDYETKLSEWTNTSSTMCSCERTHDTWTLSLSFSTMSLLRTKCSWSS